jgi:hypothetical protein
MLANYIYAQETKTNTQILTTEISSLSQSVFDLNSKRLYTLKSDELIALRDVLKSAKDILEYKYNPLAKPTSASTGLIPAIAENKEAYLQTYKKMRDFAYSMDGLNFENAESDAFATKWTLTYPSRLADKYIADFMLLLNFAQQSNTLCMFESQAIPYVMDRIPFFTPGLNLEQIFTANYYYAFSEKGLYMSMSDAYKYAKKKFEEIVFSGINFK